MRNIECGISNFYREITRVIFEYQDFTLQYGYFDFCDVMCPDNAKSLIEKMRQGKFEDWFEKNQEFINQVPPNEIWDSLEAKRNKHIEPVSYTHLKTERKGPHGGLISAVFFRKTIIIEVG